MIDMRPACRRTSEILAGVTEAQLAAPTPCSDWTVADLIAHIDEVSSGFAGLAGARTESSGDAPTHVLALAEAWQDPAAWEGTTDAGGVDLPNAVWGRIAFTEIVVHGWDLAKATGQPYDLPEETLQACLDHVAEFVPNAPVPELWGPAVDVPADAPLIDRVVAVTGRRP